MKIANLADIAATVHQSPKGAFRVERRFISEALGAARDAGPAVGGHPFEVEHVVLPAGVRNYPLHQHAAQWEFYHILKGEGLLETTGEPYAVKAGDSVMLAPGEAHAFYNPHKEPLVYLVIADNPPADVTYYPKSNKWNAKPGRLIFRETVDYYDGEE